MTLALSASLVAASAMLHRVTGVGFALLVFPLLVVIHGPRVGLGAGFVLGLTASLIVLVQCWRQVSLTRAVQLAVPSLVAIPAGAWVVRHTPTAILTIAIGLFIAVALVVGPVHRIPPLSGVKPAAAAGAAAGFTHVTSGLSVPVLALYAEATQWNQRAFASTVQLIFVVLNVASMLAVGINHATIAAVTPLVPCLLLGAVAGRPLAHRVPGRGGAPSHARGCLRQRPDRSHRGNPRPDPLSGTRRGP